MAITQTSTALANIGSYHRDGIFYFRRSATLPRICVLSGEPVSLSEPPYRHTYAKLDNPHSILSFRTIFYIFFATLFAFFLFALKPSATDVTLLFHLSPAQKHRMKLAKYGIFFLIISIVALLFFALVYIDTPARVYLANTSFILIFIAIYCAFKFKNPFRTINYKNGFYSLKGAHPKFLKALTQHEHLPSVTSHSARPKVIQMRDKRGTRDFRPPS